MKPISTRASTRTTASNTTPTMATTKQGTDIPPPTHHVNESNETIDPTSDISLTNPPKLGNDELFLSMFSNLQEKFEEMSTKLNEVMRSKQPEDDTASLHIIQPNMTDNMDTHENPPAPIVGTPETRSDIEHKRAIFGTFKAPKITPKYAVQCIDQLETWLTVNKITDDQDRYVLLKMCLEADAYRDLGAALTTKHPGKEYESLKAAIIKTYTDSEAKNIQNLLSGIKLGDRRPTQLLSEMCNLYSGPRDRIFEELFLKQLPGNVRGILISMKNKDNESKPIETIALWADSIIEQLNVSPPQMQCVNTDTNISTLENKIEHISNKIEAFTRYNPTKRFRPPFKQRSFSRAHGENFNNESNDICFFHRRYGNNRHENKKCQQPCKLYKKWYEIRNANNIVPKN
jgi:hypothetical protein